MKKILLLSLLFLSLSGYSQMATSGNQQTEIAVLRNLLAQLQAGTTSTASIMSGTFQLSCTTTSATSTGSITSGARAILLETSSDFSGIIDGNRFLGNGFMSMPLGGGAVYPAVTYTINAGTLYIKKWN